MEIDWIKALFDVRFRHVNSSWVEISYQTTIFSCVKNSSALQMLCLWNTQFLFCPARFYEAENICSVLVESTSQSQKCSIAKFHFWEKNFHFWDQIILFRDLTDAKIEYLLRSPKNLYMTLKGTPKEFQRSSKL